MRDADSADRECEANEWYASQMDADRTFIANIAADRFAGDPLERLIAAARARQAKGHLDTCSLALCGEGYECSCGHDALGEALEAFE
jgi:hypothetical protein